MRKREREPKPDRSGIGDAPVQPDAEIQGSNGSQSSLPVRGAGRACARPQNARNSELRRKYTPNYTKIPANDTRTIWLFPYSV